MPFRPSRFPLRDWTFPVRIPNSITLLFLLSIMPSILSLTDKADKEKPGVRPKEYLPLHPIFSTFQAHDAAAAIIAFSTVTFAAICGAGGGGMLVPLFIVFLQLRASSAVPLSKATINGASVAMISTVLLEHHPMSEDKPLVDFAALCLMEPSTIAGATFGVLINDMSPDALTCVLVAVCLSAISFITLRRAYHMWIAETVDEADTAVDLGASGYDDIGTALAASVSFLTTDPETGLPLQPPTGGKPQAVDDWHQWSRAVMLDDKAAKGATLTAPSAQTYGTASEPAEARVPKGAGGSAALWSPKISGARLVHSMYTSSPNTRNSNAESPFAKYAASEASLHSEPEEPVQIVVEKPSSTPRDTTALESSTPSCWTQWIYALWPHPAWRGDPRELLSLVLVWAALAVVAAMRGGPGSPFSVLQCGTTVWWSSALVVPSVVALTYSLLFYRYRCRKVTSNSNASAEERQPLNATTVVTSLRAQREGKSSELSVANTAKLVIGGYFAGMFAGEMGVGGGVFKGPLLLSLGFSPQVVAATCSVMIFFTSSTTTLNFLLLGQLRMDYAIFFWVMGFFGGLIGTALRRSVVVRGRPSVIVCILGTVSLLSGFGTFAVGLADVLANGFGSFHDVCVSRREIATME